MSDVIPGLFDEAPSKTGVIKGLFDDGPSAPRKDLIAGRYTRDKLAKKMIPQFTKGLYESDLPYAKEIVGKLPNADIIEEVQRGTPKPQGPLANIARFTGEVAPVVAMSSPFIRGAGAIPGVSRLMQTALGYGAYEGTKTALQGRPKEAPKEAAKAAGITYVGGKALTYGGKAALSTVGAGKNFAGRVVNSMIKPLLKDFSYGKNPGKAVASEGIVGNNLDELAVNITKRRKEIGKQIGDIVATPKYANTRIEVANPLQPIDAALKKAARAPRTNKAVIQRLLDLKNDLLGVVEDPKTGELVATNNLYKMTIAQAHNFKTQIGDLTKWTGNASDDKIVNKALKKTYGLTKGAMNKKTPELAPKTERYASLMSAETATVYRDKIASRQNLIGIVPKMAEYGSILTGIATGRPELVLAGAAIFGTERILSSPAVKTRFAAGLSKMSPPDMEQILLKYPQLNKIPQVAKRAFDKLYRDSPKSETAQKAMKYLPEPTKRLLLEGPKKSNLLGASREFGEGFERVSQDEATKRLKQLAMKYYSPAKEKIEFPTDQVFGTKAKTILKGMGINPITGKLRSERAKTALEIAMKRAKK